MSHRRTEEKSERVRETAGRVWWTDTYETLAAADRAAPLDADDLELLATAAYMLGRDGEYVEALERAHQRHIESGAEARAARCAFWLGLSFTIRHEAGVAAGWFGRAQRLLEREQHECVERGYLLIPDLFAQRARGAWDAVEQTAEQAAAVAERFADRDLFALAVHEQGYALALQGRLKDGLRLLDEAMLAAIRGELSPIVTGIVYCSAIAYCHDLYELRRADEWTDALTRWCDQQPDMVAHTGICLVHRAEIMERRGAWEAALEEARYAAERLAARVATNAAAGRAAYMQGEVHRLRGAFADAEAAYREASRRGYEPQPGLALLRLAQGNAPGAAAAIRRALAETTEPLRRARLLPAHVEISLSMDDLAGAQAACSELERIAQGHPTAALAARAAHVRGAASLAAGEVQRALVSLRNAAQSWQELEAPYETAHARVLVGLGCRALGDDDGAALELDAARALFAELGAAPDLVRVDALTGRSARHPAHGLTAREAEVLRAIARGATNKAIAAELVVSERTIDRHVSNILRKLRVRSRAAATAYAYEHGLI